MDGRLQPLAGDFKTREQAAYEVLRRAITAGRWRPGESVVASRVALDLGISRIPVASAIKRLAGEGFLQVRPHKEAVIAPLDSADIREIYRMRAALEALALHEAASRVAPPDVDEVRALNMELRRVGDLGQATMAEIRAIDRAFHRRMRDIAGMPRLSHTLENLADQCEYYRACLLDQSHLAAPTPERHEPLIAALETRSVRELESLIEKHVLAGMRLILAAMEATR